MSLNVVCDEIVPEDLSREVDYEQARQSLVHAANEAGGRDNIMFRSPA